MRLSRLLPRRRDPHTVIITGIKSAVRSGNTAEVRKALLTRRTQIGVTLAEANELALLIAGRITNSLSHEEVSSRLTEMASHIGSHSTTARTWFTCENLARTIGCFVASDAFSRRGFDALRASSNPRDRFLQALHRRDLGDAKASWSQLQALDTPESRDAGHYLWLWSGGLSGRPHWSKDSRWSETLRGTQVILLGPAPTSLTKKSLTKDSLVGRVLMQDVLAWDAHTDPLGGRCELGWVSRETRNWIHDTGAWSELEGLLAVSFRVDRSSQLWPEIGTGTRRAAENPKNLMLGGSSPNMIPLMVWDVLSVESVRLTLGGTTFFASQTAYTDTNRRFKHTMGKATDETGSTGELFERCPTFARHNVTENLSLVANLAQAGAIEVDRDCRRVIDLSARDYLAELDELYGVERR